MAFDQIKGRFQLVDEYRADQKRNSKTQRVAQKHNHTSHSTALLRGQHQSGAQKGTYTRGPAYRKNQAKQKGGQQSHIPAISLKGAAFENIKVEQAQIVQAEADNHNAAEQMIYQTEKTLGELGDKISEAEKAPILAAVEKLKQENKGNNVEAIKAATEEVQKAFYAVSEKLYQQQAPQGDPGAGYNPGAAPDDGVVDADFEEVND